MVFILPSTEFGFLFNGIYELSMKWKCWDGRGVFEEPTEEEREERSGTAGRGTLVGNLGVVFHVNCLPCLPRRSSVKYLFLF